MGLGGVTIGPVKDVQSSVRTQGEQIMGGDAFGLSGFTDHE